MQRRSTSGRSLDALKKTARCCLWVPRLSEPPRFSRRDGSRPRSDHASFSFGERPRVAGRAIQLESAPMPGKRCEAIIRFARKHAQHLQLTDNHRLRRFGGAGGQGKVSPDAGITRYAARNCERIGTLEDVSAGHNCQHLILNPARQHLAKLRYGIDVRKVLHQFFTDGFQSVTGTNTTDRGSFNR